MSATTAEYDPVSAAYIFKNLVALVTCPDQKYRLAREGDQTDNIREAWFLSVRASLVLGELVQPVVYQDRLFLSEQLEGKAGDRLAALLVEFHHNGQMSTVKLGIRRWMLERNLSPMH